MLLFAMPKAPIGFTSGASESISCFPPPVASQGCRAEWLAGLREICIDPVRAPMTYEEFWLKEYLRDKEGTWVDEIPDGNDHSIDAVRYAVMDDVLRG